MRRTGGVARHREDRVRNLLVDLGIALVVKHDTQQNLVEGRMARLRRVWKAMEGLLLSISSAAHHVVEGVGSEPDDRQSTDRFELAVHRGSRLLCGNALSRTGLKLRQ